MFNAQRTTNLSRRRPQSIRTVTPSLAGTKRSRCDDDDEQCSDLPVHQSKKLFTEEDHENHSASEVVSLEEQVAKYKAELSDCLDTIDCLSKRLDTEKQQNFDLRSELENALFRADSLSKDSIKYEKEADNAKIMVEDKELEARRLQKALEEKEKEAEYLKAALKTADQRLKAANQDLNKSNQQLSKVKARNNKLEAIVKNCTDDVASQLMTENDCLHKACTRAKQERDAALGMLGVVVAAGAVSGAYFS